MMPEFFGEDGAEHGAPFAERLVQDDERLFPALVVKVETIDGPRALAEIPVSQKNAFLLYKLQQWVQVPITSNGCVLFLLFPLHLVVLPYHVRDDGAQETGHGWIMNAVLAF